MDELTTWILLAFGGLVAGKLDRGLRMVTIRHTIVDRKGIAALEFDHVAEGGESLARDRRRPPRRPTS